MALQWLCLSTESKHERCPAYSRYFMRDGIHLSGKDAAVFADELSGKVDSGMGSFKNICGSKHSFN